MATHPPKHFLIVRGWLGILPLPYPSGQIVPQKLFGGQIWNFMWPVQWDDVLFARKSRQNLATCRQALSAVKSADVAAREGLQRAEYLRVSCRPLQQPTMILPHAQCLPRPIPFVNANVGEAFPATSENMTSTIRAKQSETKLFRKKTPAVHCLIRNRLGALSC